MDYKEYNILTKFVLNKIDSFFFKEALDSFIPHVTDSYAEEKWKIFIEKPMVFLGTFDKEFYEYVLIEMNKIDYQG